MKHIFIINPTAGKKNMSANIRKKLLEKKELEGFDYLVFDSEYSGHEKVLTERICNIFNDEDLRFYACGGSGTLQHILSGIKSLSRTEVACIPCGLTNDIIKCFDGAIDNFNSVDHMISGDTVNMDIIEINNKVRIVNTISIGFENCFKTFEMFQWLSRINRQLPYNIIPALTVLTNMSKDYKVEINKHSYDDKYALLYLANGRCFGGNMYPIPYANPQDGRLDFLLYRNRSKPEIIKDLKPFKEGDIPMLKAKVVITDGTNFSVRRADGKTIIANLDGEAMELKSITGTLLKNKLKFVVPLGVEMRKIDRI